MFENYPKKRIELPEAFQKIYADHYKKNRDGATAASSLSQKMEVWLHKKVAADATKNQNQSTLEIGAGTLNQLKYEQTQPYDIIEPFKELYAGSPLIKNVRAFFSDIDEIDLSNKYDRITSVATFEHITDLPKVVAKTCLLLNETGCLRTSIPNEGHFLWTLGWKATTGLEFKIKHGLDYGTLMKYEHVNNADEIEEILNYFYKNISCAFLGIGKNISLYRYYECVNPNIELAKAYLDKIKSY
jgi:hypothetical protein